MPRTAIKHGRPCVHLPTVAAGAVPGAAVYSVSFIFPPSCGNVCSFPMAAATNDHTLVASHTHTHTRALLQLWRKRVIRVKVQAWADLVPSAGSRGESLSLPTPFLGSWILPPSSKPGAQRVPSPSLTSAFVVTSPCLTLVLSPSCKDSCDHTGPTWTIQDDLPDVRLL